MEMLNKIELKLKRFMSGFPQEESLEMESNNNPLAGYLKIFQNQHRLIFLLYCGLIVIFSAFLVLNSLFIYNMRNSEMVPEWGLFTLAAVDIILFASLYRVWKHFFRFRQKSQKSLSQVGRFLKKDLSKIERIKNEHANISDTHKALQDRIKLLTGKKLLPKVEDYKGWDKRACSRCGSSFDMSETTCPYCKQKQDKSFFN